MPRAFYINDDDLDYIQRIFTCTTPRKIENINHSKDYAMTYAQIGAVIGVSKQRAEQICIEAMAKIRKRYRYSD